MTYPRRRHHGPARLATLAVGVTLVVAATGCASSSAQGGSATSSGSDSSGTLAPVQSGVVKVEAVDNNFQAQEVTVTAGSKVVWTNDGRNDHNVKAVDGNDFGVETKDFHPGASYSATFATPGTYHYYCTIHGTTERGMVGTIQVVAP